MEISYATFVIVVLVSMTVGGLLGIIGYVWVTSKAPDERYGRVPPDQPLPPLK